MYSRKEASAIRSEFWTRFGQYMSPVTGASGDRVNWINFKTGVKGIRITLNFSNKEAEVQIIIDPPEEEKRLSFFNQFRITESELRQGVAEEWIWVEEDVYDGRVRSRIFARREGVNIFKRETWPEAISFLKQQMIVLERYWGENKEIYSMMA